MLCFAPSNKRDATDNMAASASAFHGFFDEELEEFLEAMRVHSGLVVDESSKGDIAKLWRECATDATRVLMLREQMSAHGTFAHKFACEALAKDTMRNISDDAEEKFDEWNYNLGWHLAEKIMGVATWVQSDAEEEDEDEPVEVRAVFSNDGETCPHVTSSCVHRKCGSPVHAFAMLCGQESASTDDDDEEGGESEDESEGEDSSSSGSDEAVYGEK